MTKEYAIWGIPAGQVDETLLLTMIADAAKAEELRQLITLRHGVTETRVQCIDFETPPDFNAIFRR